MKKRLMHTPSNLLTKKLSFITSLRQSQPRQVKSHAVNKRKFIHLALKGLFLAAFIGLAIGGIFYLWLSSTPTSKAQSETFTELYFEDSANLPSVVVPKHPYLFQFTLHNLEGKNMEYPYEVYVEIGQERLILDKGTVFLNKNAYATIPENFATTNVWPRSEIVVNLINTNQQIDFWIEGSKG